MREKKRREKDRRRRGNKKKTNDDLRKIDVKSKKIHRKEGMQ